MDQKNAMFSLQLSLKELQESYNHNLKQNQVLRDLANEYMLKDIAKTKRIEQLEEKILSLSGKLYGVALELYLEDDF
jgi:hypothetical protein